MVHPVATSLFFAPSKTYVEATVCSLTEEMIQSQIMREWWAEECLKPPVKPPPIDRYWDWRDVQIEFDGRILAHEKIAILAGPQQVQGAMLISREPVDSVLEQNASALWVEWLFTAPRNRPELRIDGKQYITGVGTQLLRWAVEFSRELGHGGRFRLDGSPEFVEWYERRGLQKLNLKPNVFEDVAYVPMELPTGSEFESLR